MWKPIKINEKTHFLLTTIEGNTVECILHDFHEWWSSRLKVDELFRQAKACNKRIQYEENIVREVLQNNEPEEVSVDALGDDKKLKLKYRINQRPFRYEWSLTRQTEEEMHKLLLIPLFQTVCEMSQSLDELREVISKKDNELKQYKVEFQLLRRTTVQTEPFDFPKFDSQRATSKQFVEGCHKMLQQLESQYQLPTNAKSEPPKTPTKHGGTQHNHKSPKDKKRKLLEEEKRVMLLRLQAKQKKLTYIESQSQSQEESQEQPSGVDAADALSCKEEAAEETPYFNDIPNIEADALPTTSKKQKGISTDPSNESSYKETEKEFVENFSPLPVANATCSDMPHSTLPLVKQEDSLLDLDLTKEFQELGEIVDRLKQYNRQT